MFVLQHSQPLHNAMRKEKEAIGFSTNFEVIDSFWNNGTKYMLVFDQACENVTIKKNFMCLLLLDVIVGWGLKTF